MRRTSKWIVGAYGASVIGGALSGGCGVDASEVDEGLDPSAVTAHAGAGAAPACDDDDDDAPEDLAAQLARVRAATERYQDVAVALAEGFIADPECVSSPDGAMGYHFVFPARLMDPLDLEQPEALLYVRADDSYRLVAVEYLLPILVGGVPYMGCGVNDPSCPPAEVPEAPVLFTGIPFDGPMAGHSPMMPWHFDQHVWLYEDNPSGMFAPYNPALSCDAECGHHDDDDEDDGAR